MVFVKFKFGVNYKKILAIGMFLSILSSIAPSYADVVQNNYPERPIETVYFCNINGDKCKVTEQHYSLQGETRYHAVCNAPQLRLAMLKRKAVQDIKYNRQKYCSPNF